MTNEDTPAVARERLVTEGLRRGARVRHRRTGRIGTVYFSAVHYAHKTTGPKPRVCWDDESIKDWRPGIGNYVERHLELIGWVDPDDLITPVPIPADTPSSASTMSDGPGRKTSPAPPGDEHDPDPVNATATTDENDPVSPSESPSPNRNKEN